MKIGLTCLVCAFPDEGGDISQDFRLYDKNVNDDGVYELECAFGHRTKYFVQEEPFQVLFEIALNAIVDGYYREAVASATAALERFYAFFTAVVCRAKEVTSEATPLIKKAVGNQSERQLGMFIAAHLLNNKTFPRLMSTDGSEAPSVGFRNAVTHKGKIPSIDEAKIYVQEVLVLIGEGIRSLCTTCLQAYHEEAGARIRERQRKLGKQHRVTTTIVATIPLFVHEATEITVTVEERLVVIAKRRTLHEPVDWAPPLE